MLGTKKYEGDNDEKGDGFFVCDFRYFGVHEQQVDETVFGPKRDYQALLLFFIGHVVTFLLGHLLGHLIYIKWQVIINRCFKLGLPCHN